jgi:peptidyl-prolyl cis-trans isomerase D
MLLAIRERVMGVVGWILLGFLAIAFAFFGLNSYLGDTSRPYAASVNDVEISGAEVQRTYQLLRANVQAQLGQSFDPSLIDEEILRKNSLQQLIREQLLLQAAEAAGFEISEELVAARISQTSSFRDRDSFSKEKYERILRSQGLSPGEFEWRLSRELLTRQFLNGITETAESTGGLVDRIYRLQAQQRRFKYLLFPVEQYKKEISVSEEEVEKYHTENNREFMSPERVRLQYVELDGQALKVVSDVTDEELRALYEEQADLYTTPKEVRARHIPVKTAPDAGEEGVAQARDRAESILQQLDQGASFEELAKQESDDPGSAGNGGDLGYFGEGIMAPEFEAAAFALGKGERSHIVKTQFGFHIIEVTDIKPEVVKSFDDVREEITAEYTAHARSNLFFDQADLLANLAFEEPESLESVAAELGLEIKSTDWLTREGGTGIGEHRQIINAAFQQDVLEDGNNSEPIEIADDHLVVIRILEHEPAAVKPLDTVMEEVRRAVQDAKARELAAREGESIIEELGTGKPLEDIAARLELEIMDSGLIGRGSDKPEREIVQKAFLMPRPAAESASQAGLALANGDYVVILLQEILDGSTEKLSSDERKRIARELSSIQGRSEIAAVIESLKDNATIIIPEEKN